MRRTVLLTLLTCVLSSAAVVGTSAGAQGVAIPNYDIAKSCAGAPDAHGCSKIEANAKQRLQVVWATLTPEKRYQCHEVGKSQGGSYVAALGCAT